MPWREVLLVAALLPDRVSVALGIDTPTRQSALDSWVIGEPEFKYLMTTNVSLKWRLYFCPIPVPRTVLQGLEAALATDATLIYSWVALRRTAIELGYPETATWIESHLEKYVLGVERGFIAEDQ